MKYRMALVGLLLVCCCGCGVFYGITHPFTTPAEDSTQPAAITTPAPHLEVGALGPFPWGWVTGLGTIGAAVVGLLIVTGRLALVDEAIVATVGAIAVMVFMDMVRELWQAKWLMIGGFAVLMAALAAWKLSRKNWVTIKAAFLSVWNKLFFSSASSSSSSQASSNTSKTITSST